MANVPVVGLVTHTRKVQSLYKRALRNIESWVDRREFYRYHAVLLRDRFDQNKCVKDMRIAKDLIAQGEEELFKKKHWQVKTFQYSPGGVAYEREVIPPDWILDYWHPLEKAQYPDYFACREVRKKEFVARWDKKYGDKSSI